MGKKDPATPIATVLGPLRADLALLALAGGAQLRRLDPYTWQVTSSHHGRAPYSVTRDPADVAYQCTCQAGANDLDCRHAALVLLVEATGAVEAIHPYQRATRERWES